MLQIIFKIFSTKFKLIKNVSSFSDNFQRTLQIKYIDMHVYSQQFSIPNTRIFFQKVINSNNKGISLKVIKIFLKFWHFACYYKTIHILQHTYKLFFNVHREWFILHFYQYLRIILLYAKKKMQLYILIYTIYLSHLLPYAIVAFK